MKTPDDFPAFEPEPRRPEAASDFEGSMKLSVATVRPISRTRYVIMPSLGYRVVVIGDDACILDADGTETTRLRIEPAGSANEYRDIVRGDHGSVEVIYHEGVEH